MGIISAKAAFLAYGALAVLATLTLDGDTRKIALAVLGLFAVKTYVDIVRRRMEAREAAEASTARAPVEDVVPGRDT